MRKSEIEVGGVYTDNKGNVREVIAEGPEYVIYSSQIDSDNVRYRLIEKKAGPDRVGDEKNTTRRSFASWAKTRVESKQADSR